MSKTVPIIIQWIEENPAVTRNARNQLNALERAQRQLQTALMKYIPAGQEQNRIMAHINKAVFDQEVAIRSKAQPALKILNKALNNLDEENRKVVPRMTRISKAIERWGWRLGWLGFRMVIVGRMILRYMMKPINDAIKGLTNWEKTLTEIAISLGYLEAQGLLTADMEERMLSTLEELPDAGMAVQGAMGYLTAALADIAIDIAPDLVDIFMRLADIWTDVKPLIVGIAKGLRYCATPRNEKVYSRKRQKSKKSGVYFRRGRKGMAGWGRGCATT